MEVFEQEKDGKLVLRPSGRLDSTTSVAFGQNLKIKAESGSSDIVIDFSDLEYISSAGLRTLLEAAKLLKAKEGNLSLCSLNSQVQEVFDISGFSGIFSIHQNLEGACDT